MVTHFPYDFRARTLFLVKDVRHHPSCASPSEPPTKDFLAWNGVPFGSQKTESRPGNPGQGGPEYRAKETASAKVPLGLENRANAFGPENRPNLDLLSIG